MSRFTGKILLKALVLLLAGTGFLATGQSKAEEKPALKVQKTPSVLFVADGGAECGYELALKLKKLGYNLDRIPHPGLSGKGLTWDKAKNYNVIIVNSRARANADMSLNDNNKLTNETLKRFTEEGGGLLFFTYFGQQISQKVPQEEFFKSLGMDVLVDEQPQDNETKVIATSWNLPFAYTENIAKSPVTEDVKALWYPTVPDRRGDQSHSFALKHDQSWQTVISGGKNSFTNKGRVKEPSPKGKGSYDHNVPLVAIRKLGKGRIVCLGITYEYFTGRFAWNTLEGIVLDKGLKGQKSDGLKLLTNCLKWLAEPSLTSGVLGGAKMNASMLKNPYKVEFSKPFNWAKSKLPDNLKAYPGAIGARTTYSTGKVTADEWVKAANEAGLKYLVFLENFSELSADELKRLQQDCERLSSPEFTALPGFTIDDELGNHYFYFSKALLYPDKKFLSEDGKNFISYDSELDKANPHISGQLAMTALEYAYAASSFRLTCGNYLFSKDAAPFANFFSNYDAAGVITTENGKLLEDATVDYLKLVDFGQGPLPLAITLMDSPEYLKDLKWKTVLKFSDKAERLVGGIEVNQATKIRDYFSSWHFYPDNPNKIYISSGPEIVTWKYNGDRDYGGNNHGKFIWQNYRWQLQGIVKSDKGLKQINVYDGPVLFRHFMPEGKKEFTINLELSHDKQHNLVIVAEDIDGGKAVSGEQWDRNHKLEEFNCADRNNQLTYGLTIKKDGTWVMVGGNQTLATPNKRIANGISPSGTFKNDPRLGAPAFDGGTGGEPEVYEMVIANIKGKEFWSPNVSESIRLFHSGDVNIGEGRKENYFKDNIRVANVWHTLWSTVPAEDFTVTRRNHFFQLDPDSPLAVFLWQIDIKLKKDLPNNGFTVAKINSRKEKLWGIRSSNSECYFGLWEDSPLSKPRGLKLPFDRNSYVALLDSPLGSAIVYPLTDGLNVSAWLPRRSDIRFQLNKDSSPQKAGDIKRVELLLVGVPRITKYTRSMPASSNEVAEKFYRQFGLDGGKGTYKLELAAGEVKSQRYILKIDGTKTNGMSGKISGKLISALPITVNGLNENWSVLLYDRKLKKARPLGVFENKTWATVIVDGIRDIFIGNPVIADNQDLYLQLTQSGEKSWLLEVHNPTDKPIETTISGNKLFEPLKDLKLEKITVPAGSSVSKTLQ
jgi:hypothetical protein